MSGQSAMPREDAGRDLGTRTELRWLRRLFATLVEPALAERERWALWIPALLGCGIGLYFVLTVEPPGWSGPAAIAGATLLLALARRHAALLVPGIAALIASIGFADAQLQTWLVAAPGLERQPGPVRVEGRLVEVHPFPHGYPILVPPRAIERLDTGH